MARHFAVRGIDVFGVGRNPPKPEPLWLFPPGYRYFRAHIGDQTDRVLSILDDERPDVVLNIAAQGEGAASFGEHAWRFYQTNVVYLVQLVEQLRRREYLRRFIQISTSELYGSCAQPVSEDAPLRPTSPYAISKAAFDQHLQVLHRVHGFAMNIVRPSNCLTAGMQLHRVVPRAAISAIYGQRMQLQGGGEARKSFLDTEDLARAVLAALDKGAVGEIYNAGPQEPTSIREIVRIVGECAGVPMAGFVDEVPGRVGEDSVYWLESGRLRALGWAPTVPLERAIESIVSWVRDHPALAEMPWKYEVAP